MPSRKSEESSVHTGIYVRLQSLVLDCIERLAEGVISRTIKRLNN